MFAVLEYEEGIEFNTYSLFETQKPIINKVHFLFIHNLKSRNA